MNKKQFTKLFLEQAGLDASEDSIKEHLVQWWMFPFSPVGLRLTREGSTFLYSDLKLQNYKYKIKPDTVKSLKLYLRMNKFLSSPFYLQANDTIIFYGESDAIMMGMMSGDIAQYLENFTRDQ
jgi:hypothetical protein